MGTGSFGAGGSGALGSAGSGAAAGISYSQQASAGQFFDARKTAGVAPDPQSASAILRDTFAKRTVAGFVQQALASEQVRGCYEELFNLAVLLTHQHDWGAIAREYGVTGNAGCLSNLADVIISRHGGGSREPYREVAGSAVLDVLIAAVGGDDDVFLEAGSSTVLECVDKHRNVFSSLSSHYLSSVLSRLAMRDLPALNTLEAQAIRNAAVQRSDMIIASFERTFQYRDSKKQLTHKQLLETIAEKADWFENKLREPIR